MKVREKLTTKVLLSMGESDKLKLEQLAQKYDTSQSEIVRVLIDREFKNSIDKNN